VTPPEGTTATGGNGGKLSKGGLSKIELQHLADAIETVGVPPEVVAEHCGKGASEITPKEYRALFDWLVDGVCESVGWATSDVTNEIVGICGTEKAPADMSADEFRALIEKMRGTQ